MNNTIFKYSALFILLILLQVLILNNVKLFGYMNPLVYILFIFLYPIKKEKGTFLILSFFLGLCIDFFSNSGGSNAAAMVFIAYLRLPVLHIIQNKSEFDYLLFNIKNLNFIQLTTYILSLTTIHHIVLFLLEYYKLSNIFDTLILAVSTSLFTSLLIAFSISLFVKNNKA